MNNDSAMNPITEDDIADYLANSPDFFSRHAQLLGQVQLTSPHGNRAVSLQERQAEMLREKIKALEHRLIDMMRHGTENVVTADRLQRRTAGLLVTRDPRALPRQVAQQLHELFLVPQVAIRIWDLDAAFAGEPFAQPVSEDVKALASSLEVPYCGLNSGFEASQWLDDPRAAVSISLIPLRGERGAPAFGMIVLASPDAQRFHADMGTDFLERIGTIASAAISRLRP
ncbi:MAG: DUF484 family protein [Comamonadaceae bacterium]|nr:MAG: DUF484 family protein [Comamonadaceae bacterium]